MRECAGCDLIRLHHQGGFLAVIVENLELQDAGILRQVERMGEVDGFIEGIRSCTYILYLCVYLFYQMEER